MASHQYLHFRFTFSMVVQWKRPFVGWFRLGKECREGETPTQEGEVSAGRGWGGGGSQQGRHWEEIHNTYQKNALLDSSSSPTPQSLYLSHQSLYVSVCTPATFHLPLVRLGGSFSVVLATHQPRSPPFPFPQRPRLDHKQRVKTSRHLV
jgi:hypothetical protein